MSDVARILSRRQMLLRSGLGFGHLALLGMLGAPARVQANPVQSPLAPQSPRFPARAKRVIFLFMHGGPSHVDTFD